MKTKKLMYKQTVVRPHLTMGLWPTTSIASRLVNQTTISAAILQLSGCAQYQLASLFIPFASNSGPEKAKYVPQTNYTWCSVFVIIPLTLQCLHFIIRAYTKLSISFLSPIKLPTSLSIFESLLNARYGGWFPCEGKLWINSLCSFSFQLSSFIPVVSNQGLSFVLG